MTSLPRFGVKNPVLMNLLMVTILVGGVWAAFTLVREMFPQTTPQRVSIITSYPGATPTEVEKGITLKIEEQIKDVDGVDNVLSTVTDGLSSITVEMVSGYRDIDQAVTDIKAAIDTIPREDFPEDALETQVSKLDPQLPVISVAMYGDLSERRLKALSEDLRDELLALPDVTDVTLTGTRKDEISVEVEPQKLVEYNLSFMDVARAIGASNLDLPGGVVRTKGTTVAVRTLGERKNTADMLDIVLRSDEAGRTIRVRDVATITDGFEDVDIAGRFDGKPAVNAIVYKTDVQDAIKIAAEVRALVYGKMHRPLERSWKQRVTAAFSGHDTLGEIYQQARREPFPPDVSLNVHSDLSRYVKGRLELLERNGVYGLVLVTLSLLLFLHWRVAFWVMMGLVLAVAGSLLAMKLLGQSLNLMTMFGLIIVLGLLVDDAIVVSENVYSKVENGMEPRLAAVVGAEEVTWPVVCAVTTTIVAFAPLMHIQGRIGDFMGVLPVIVCIALTVSLLEALSILPAHLAHGMKPAKIAATEAAGRGGLLSPLFAVTARLRSWQDEWIQRRLRNGYEAFLRSAVRHRYVTMSILVAILIVTVGAVAGGHAPFVLLQHMDSETLMANVTMEVGAPLEETQRATSVIEKCALALPETKTVYTLLGLQAAGDGTVSPPQSHLGQVLLEITDAEKRTRTSDELLAELREQTGDIVGVRKLRFSAIQGGPTGSPIHLEISGPNTNELLRAAQEVEGTLSTFEGVSDIVDDFDAGRREVRIELLPSARALGLTTQSLATQVRAAFYGYEARKIQRGREDVKIMVRYPLEYRRHLYDIETMRVAMPDGTLVPFREVARLTEGTGFASIKRKNQRRTVTVNADVDENVTNAEQVIGSLKQGFPRLLSEYPTIRLEFGGQKLETQKSLGSLKTDFVAALLLIYAILAALFKSYVEPVIVMTVIPFGLIGAVAGHFLMGYPLTILSMIGLVALTGIVVNDSMILLVFIQDRIESGMDVFEAVIDGGRSRLRPILLTSLTTVLGIAPLLLEKSFQAKFLIPMGISISAGLIFATVLTLVAIPSIYLIVYDIRRVLSIPKRMPEPLVIPDAAGS